MVVMMMIAMVVMVAETPWGSGSGGGGYNCDYDDDDDNTDNGDHDDDDGDDDASGRNALEKGKVLPREHTADEVPLLLSVSSTVKRNAADSFCIERNCWFLAANKVTQTHCY